MELIELSHGSLWWPAVCNTTVRYYMTYLLRLLVIIPSRLVSKSLDVACN